jgi:hypothetical protein
MFVRPKLRPSKYFLGTATLGHNLELSYLPLCLTVPILMRVVADFPNWPKAAVATIRRCGASQGIMPCPCSRLVQACHLRRTESQAEAEDHAKFVVTSITSAYPLRAMKFRPLPSGSIVPAQPVKASEPPVGTDWVHEIKHDGYRMIIRRDGPSVRLYSRNALDWTTRLSAIATAAHRSKPRVSRSTARRLYRGPMVCRCSTSCADGRLPTLRSSTPSTSSNMMARICAISHSSTARGRARAAVAQYRGWHPVQPTHRRGRRCRVRARLPAWRRGHRVEEGRWHLSIRPVPRLDQGPQSGLSVSLIHEAPTGSTLPLDGR